MSSLRFAYKAVVRVYKDDPYGRGEELFHESLIEELTCDSFQYDGHNEREFILEGMDWPREGYFSIWIVGKFVWHTDYWGETDMDVEIDVEDVSPASLGDMEAATGYQCYTDENPPLFDFTFE